MVIRRMKPRGNGKISYDPIFHSFFYQGKNPNLALIEFCNLRFNPNTVAKLNTKVNDYVPIQLMINQHK
jgi:hypothetical protein